MPATFAECTRLSASGLQVFFILALFPVFLAITLWIIRQPPFSGKKFFVVANWALIGWLFAVVMELASVSAGCKVFWGTIAFPSIGVLSVSWFLFVYRYTRNKSGAVLPWQWALLVIVPTLGTIAAVSTSWHGLFYGPETAPVNAMPGAPIVYDHGVLFYANAALLYIFITASFVILAVSAVRNTGIVRLMYLTLFLMTAVPTLANVSYITMGVNIAGFDPTPFVFSFLLLAYSGLISLNNFFQVSSIAKDMIFDNLPNAVVVVTREGRIIAANLFAQKVLKFTPRLDISARDVPVLSDLMALTTADTPDGQSFETSIEDEEFEVTLTPVYNLHKQIIGYTFVFFEVTSRKKAQQALSNALHSTDARLDEALQQNRQMSDEALTDVLTGLLNRRSLPAVFEAMTNPQPNQEADPKATSTFAVIIDIDHFKAVNDRLGHGVGDRVLIAVGKCLRAAFRTEDKVFRVGGEEFLILSAGIEIQALHGRIANLRRSVADAGKTLLPVDMPITFSAGIGVWPADAHTLTDLLEIADKRLYSAKGSGRNRTVGPLAEVG